jgi:hypothetical protein
LRFGGLNQPRSRSRLIDSAGSHPLEAPIEPKGVEDVAGTAELVTACFEIPEAAHRRDRNFCFRLEPGNDGKRSAGVASCLHYPPRALNLIDVTVDDDHLAVEVGKRAEAKISVFEDRLAAHLTIVNARDDGA